MEDKGKSLLAFLQAVASIRRKRISSYGSTDKILWIADIPKGRAECRSPFLTDKPDDWGEIWLEVRKKRMPVRPPVPQVVADWVRVEDLDHPEGQPKLLPEIKVIVKRKVPGSDAGEEVIELHRLVDHPEVEKAWYEYLVEKWEPWAQEMRQWQEVQKVYENLDFMRRRLEEAEERYELVLAIGFLQWRDPTGTNVARHVLTAPAEITLDAARGVLTVQPSASFDSFCVELDMLELQDRPPLNKDSINEKLETLDIQAWNIELVAPLLHEIANNLRANAQVDEGFEHADRIEDHPRLSFAPALVLRERRQIAYDELIGKFLNTATTNGLRATAPWLRLVQEGRSSHDGPAEPIAAPENNASSFEEDRLLFPLPTNEEQRQIANRLRTDPCVLVKGPPGTGKSHTIANLICHLLARGERILVTAHAPKALIVLRALLPPDIRDLCVTALGSSQEDQRLLEESVRGILRRWNDWCEPEAAQQEIEKAERDLRELEDELARVERDLRIFREVETYLHKLPGGYSGTAAQIARLLSEREHEFGWFSELFPNAEFPLDPSESDFLVEAHSFFTADVCTSLQIEVGEADLPSPDEFAVLIKRLSDAKELAQCAQQGVENSKVGFLQQVGTEQLRQLRQALKALDDHAFRASRVLGEGLLGIILQDLLASAESKWARRAAYSEALLEDATRLLKVIGSAQVEIPDRIPENQLATDVQRLLAHFEAGGWKGFSVFVPRVVRETRYIVNSCRVDGKKVAHVEQLRCIHAHLELQRKVRKLQELWDMLLKRVPSYRDTISQAAELTAELKKLLQFFKPEPAGVLVSVLGSNGAALVATAESTRWLMAIDAVLALREAREAQQELDQLLQAVRTHYNTNPHPCMSALESAIQTCDVDAWRTAWQERERIRREKQRLTRYQALLEKLDRACPGLAKLLRSTGGEPISCPKASGSVELGNCPRMGTAVLQSISLRGAREGLSPSAAED
ncbi:MAG: AAA domain-containing protein [Bacteroidota bacterium]|nr:AAA domain-containing protein [Bacteroidota bacterium]